MKVELHNLILLAPWTCVPYIRDGEEKWVTYSGCKDYALFDLETETLIPVDFHPRALSYYDYIKTWTEKKRGSR